MLACCALRPALRLRQPRAHKATLIDVLAGGSGRGRRRTEMSASTNPVQKVRGLYVTTNGKDELVEIVDRSNQVLAPTTRREMREHNLIHRCSFVFVRNAQGELYVQKRVAFKETYPSHYDPCPGGVVGAGESYEENALREVEEEMGITGVQVKELFDLFYEDDVTRLWGRAFECEYNGEVTLQEEEVESGAFLKMEEVQKLVQTHPTCPDSKAVFERYLSQKAEA